MAIAVRFVRLVHRSRLWIYLNYLSEVACLSCDLGSWYTLGRSHQLIVNPLNQRFFAKNILAMPTPPENSFHPLTRPEWRAWLAENYSRKTGIWMISYKKATGEPFVDYDSAVEEALCFGWIDSKPNKLDQQRTMLWFAPRKSRTGWSKLNKDRIERLQAAGLLAEPGLAKIAAAQADGSWTALDAIEALEIPEDLTLALTAHPPAAANFAAFPRSAKRGILEWISTARRPETRAKRVEETAVLAAQNKRANQWQRQ
jgi:uncharacterized protein YdeI (YjbR/CyaY-like superfamily)